MSEQLFNHRELTASILDQPLSEIDPVARPYVRAGELVLDLAASGYSNMPLADVESDDKNDLPRAWRFAVPSTEHPNGLAVVSYAINTEDLGTGNNTVARFDHELSFNDALKSEFDKNAAIRGLYRAAGEDIAQLVSASGATFFSGLERRYRFDPTANTYQNWLQLAYSKQLLHTTKFMQQKNNTSRQREGTVPA